LGVSSKHLGIFVRNLAFHTDFPVFDYLNSPKPSFLHKSHPFQKASEGGSKIYGKKKCEIQLFKKKAEFRILNLLLNNFYKIKAR